MRDCEIVKKRIESENQQVTSNVQKDNDELANIAQQIAELQKQIEEFRYRETQIRRNVAGGRKTLAQNNVNLKALGEWTVSFMQDMKRQQYIDRCTDYIKKYLETNNNTLPEDAAEFLNLDSTSLDVLTSDEIIELAHYIHACTIIQNKNKTLFNEEQDDDDDDDEEQDDDDDDDEEQDDDEDEGYVDESTSERGVYRNIRTYRQLFNYSDVYSERFSFDPVRYCGELYDCRNYRDEYSNCCHKRYAWILLDFYDITLDTTQILDYGRVN